MAEETSPALLTLPSELVTLILSFLSPTDLAAVSEVNKFFKDHAFQDTLWHAFVQSSVPGITVPKPESSTWRQLFISHHPFWFIPKNKVWFGDNTHIGKLIIARYDHRLDTIEAYALVAERRTPDTPHWDWAPDAIVHTFSPRLQLDLNSPVLRLVANSFAAPRGYGRQLLQKEFPMDVHGALRSSLPNLYSNLFLNRELPGSAITPSTRAWPPSIIPSSGRVRNESATEFRDIGHRPTTLSELSTNTFRIRKWMEFMSQPHRPEGWGGFGVRVGEDVTTFATLPEECYVPTEKKPYQGIWCGDYAGHGCEFLLITQPDHPKPLPAQAEVMLKVLERDNSVSTEASWSTAPMDLNAAGGNSSGHDGSSSESVHDDDEDGRYQGRIEAIKLTGDPNVPRGEYTFIAPDIGPDGLLRVAHEELFKGARVVRALGHIASRGFRDDKYIPSQLILLSHDKIAQFWETYNHVSFYQRVNIDEFTRPV
ncbi:F-box domain-containing protein [Delitschia confertaspora ATCC 74209]|uniref:F-box domain-containing protein n=1 Tax=Delitschia confertaspora ATCC 74209 TaxID=1513339 RepID=A0A9P4JQF9_9PLEO|nr:F-box domain-containing protein [Delitschia confertaspora ATCC 74209]